MKKGKSRHKRKKSRLLWIAIAVIGMAAVISAVCVAGMLATKENAWRTPEELLVEYMYHIPKKEYEEMYAMLHVEASGSISQEDFIKRNSAIYEGIEVQNMAVRIIAYDEEQMTVTYQTSFDTVAGTISFENEALFLKDEEGYKLVWDDSMIFRNLTSTDKVRVSTTQAERGEILDRNGRVLAGKGTASSVGIVPGKLENREEAIAQIAELVEITPEAIEKKLSAKWVKDDSFVPIKTIPRVEEIELMSISPDEEVLKEKERHEKLLEIPGVMISDVEVREYPLGEAAAHLVGYVQSVTAEDLEEHAGEGYTANSVIGRSGMAGLFESEFKGQNGCRIYIVNSEGNGDIQREVTGSYQAEYWNYTEEGYLMFSGVWFSEELYVLTLSGAEEHTALRVQPLDETYRELSRKYLRPIGFEQNNMFIVDWSEDDFGALNFYDMYDILYPKVNGQYVPYIADDNLAVSAVYRIPKEEFESVIMKYFNIDSETLQSKTVYYSEDSTYEYKPRGFEEVEYPEYPYSEVVDFTENSDGTITLTANVVFPYAGDSKVYAHEVVVRPLEDGGVQYVSNQIIPSEDNYEETWHTPRLTLEEWEELYGGE